MTTNATGDGRPVDKDHNRKAVEAAEAAQLVSVLSLIRAQKVKTEEKRAALKDEQDKETELFRAAKATGGFQRKELESYLADMTARGRNVAADEQRRTRHRRALMLPVGDVDDQGELPIEVRDESDWRSDGYRAGLIGGDSAPPKDCHTRFIQAYTDGYTDGQRVLAERMKLAGEAKTESANAAVEAARARASSGKPKNTKTDNDPRVDAALKEMADEAEVIH